MNKYKILIKGKNPEYFLNLLVKKGFEFTNVDKNYKELTLIVDEHNYKKLLSLKTSYKINILKLYGPIKYKNIIRKNIIFFIGIFLFIALVNLVTNFIFKIEIIHEDKKIVELIQEQLKLNDIEIFSLKKNKNELNKIVGKILDENNNEIEWMEIKEIGVTYKVEVQSRKIKKEKKECSPQSIVAKKDSRIISIFAKNGEVVKKKNDYVKTGDVIISGLIYNKEKIMNKKCATGKIFGEVWYNINIEIPKNYIVVNKTDKENIGIEIEFLNNKFPIIGGFKNYESKKLNIISSKAFPFSLSFSNFLELDIKKYKFNYKNVDKKALEIAEKTLFKKSPKDSEVLTKKVLKKTEKDSKIIVEVFFKIKEDITDTSSLKDINIELENTKIKEE